MNRTTSIFTIVFGLFVQSAFALTDADAAALKQLTKDYVSWDYTGRPVQFRERLDYNSFEEQRQILLKLAKIEWSGIWGDYWRKRGMTDLNTLRALSPRDFWLRFNSVLKPRQGSDGHANDDLISVDIHAITEARGYVYVIYQVSYETHSDANDDKFEVLRARWSDGEWRLVAFPRVTLALHKQLRAAEEKK